MPTDATRNSLVLPLLGLLVEQPTHAYELTAHLNERYPRLNATRSTVTTLLRTLERNGLVTARAPEQVGNRPQRTVYELTEPGFADFRAKVEAGLSEATPASADFALAVGYAAILPGDQAVGILDARAERLDRELEPLRQQYDLPEVHMLEVPYWRSILTTELTWVRTLAERIRTGDIAWPDRRAEGTEA